MFELIVGILFCLFALIIIVMMVTIAITEPWAVKEDYKQFIGGFVFVIVAGFFGLLFMSMGIKYLDFKHTNVKEGAIFQIQEKPHPDPFMPKPEIFEIRVIDVKDGYVLWETRNRRRSNTIGKFIDLHKDVWLKGD